MTAESAMDERVRIKKETLLSANWGKLTKYEFDLKRRDGQWQSQIREVYDRGNAAVILLIDPVRGTVILTRQFRFPAHLLGDNPMLIEACAGLLDGDPPEVCARKEAEEETGYRVGAVTHLFDSYMSPGSVTEKLSFFLGTYEPSSRISDGGGLEDEGEDIEVMELPFETALQMVKSGEIVDAKTIMLLQHAAMGGVFAARKA
jgi:nudix-type nucleoside diphosphatase (YffH/AdpP family)